LILLTFSEHPTIADIIHKAAEAKAKPRAEPAPA
jgi:hypothetical protein